jgi:triacylglycerol lipase
MGEQPRRGSMVKMPPVVLVPPLIMTRYCMVPLARHLQASGRRTLLFGYPSYRRDIPANGQRLARFLEVTGEPELDLVTFSLGSIVLRWAAAHEQVPRLRRVVMIGPPNQGAVMASMLSRWLGPAFRLWIGRSALQLRRGDEGLCASAGTLPPGTELGIIAGAAGRPWGFNPLIRGDNDRVVAVEETFLQGMTAFVTVRCGHGPLIVHRSTWRHVEHFLEHGTFDPALPGPADGMWTDKGRIVTPAVG